MTRFRFASMLSPVALLIAAPAMAQLTPAEHKMQITVDAEHERTVALLEKLVNQNSGSMNLEGVEAVGKMMRAELEPLGFRVTWLPMRETGRAGHLVAVHQGRKGTKRILLIAHLDTVFEKDSPFQKFVRGKVNGVDTAEGPGASDDKGGLVTMVAALRAMQAAGTLKNANIEIHMTGDEEDTGRLSYLLCRSCRPSWQPKRCASCRKRMCEECNSDSGSLPSHREDWGSAR